eukprot:SAG31_NODE_166_length_21670_cov_22.507719_13_plen_74_part_00
MVYGWNWSIANSPATKSTIIILSIPVVNKLGVKRQTDKLQREKKARERATMKRIFAGCYFRNIMTPAWLDIVA